MPNRQKHAEIKLNADLLVDLGYRTLTASQANQLLRELYEALEFMVGLRLAEDMTDRQLDQFETFIDQRDEEGARLWLDRNLPDHRAVIEEVFSGLQQELRSAAREQRIGYHHESDEDSEDSE